MQSKIGLFHRRGVRVRRGAAAIVAAVGLVQFAGGLETARAVTYTISTAGASALGSFDRDNSSSTNPASGSFSPGVLALGQASLTIGNTTYTQPNGGGQVLFGADTQSQENAFAANGQDEIQFEFSETGSVFGLADLTNSNGLSTALNPGSTSPTPGNATAYPLAPNSVIPLWVNGVQFTAPNTTGTGPSGAVVRTIGSGATGQPPVQIGFSDVKFEQAYAISGTPSMSATPMTPGYGLGKGPTLNATSGQPSGTNFQQLANASSIIGGIAASTTYLRDQTVAVEAFNVVANPGTGLGEISKSDSQWLSLTGRFQNGANFNVATRDIGSGTRNEGALNLGVDPSYASGERDRIATANYPSPVPDYNGNMVQVNAGDEADPLFSLSGGSTLDVNENRVGPDIRFADKPSGGNGVRATVVANRMGLGILGGGDSNSGSGSALDANSGASKTVGNSPALRALAVDFGKGNGFTQATVANISAGLYDLWSNSQAITVAPYANPTLNDQTYTTQPVLNDLLEQNNGTTKITTNPATYQNLATSDPNGPGLVRKFVNNIVNSVTTISGSSPNITPADYLMSGGYILPQVMQFQKTYDGGSYSSNASNFNQSLYNQYATGSGLMAENTDWADPNTTNGSLTGSQTYQIFSSDNNAVNGAVANLTIPISPRTTLIGDFNNTGVRDNQQVPALALAYASPSTYLATPASGDPRGFNYDGTDVTAATHTFAGIGSHNYASTIGAGSTGTANPGDGLIVLSDFDGQGNVTSNSKSNFAVVDGVTRANVLFYLYGCTIDTQDSVPDTDHAGQFLYQPGGTTTTLNGATEGLSAAQNAQENGTRYGHLTKNASIIAFNNTLQGFVTGGGSTSLGMTQAQVNSLMVDRFDTNLDGAVNIQDARTVDALVGRDYTNINDVESIAPIVQNNQVVPVDPIVAAELLDKTTITNVANTSLPAGQQSDMQEIVYHLQGRDVDSTRTGNEVDSVNQLLNGDANFDGTVNILDLGILKKNYFKSGQTTWSAGDFNFDGSVGILDLADIKKNYFQTAMGSQTYNGQPVAGSPDFVGSGTHRTIPNFGFSFAMASAVTTPVKFGIKSQVTVAGQQGAPTLTANEITLAINIITGDAMIYGDEPATARLGGYEIDDASKNLNYPAWNSLHLQGVKATPSGNASWTVFGTPYAGGLSESTAPGSGDYNTVGTGNAAPVFDIGHIYIPGAPEDLVFTALDDQSNQNNAPAVEYYVPEPGCIALLAFAGMILGRRRRCKALSPEGRGFGAD